MAERFIFGSSTVIKKVGNYVLNLFDDQNKFQLIFILTSAFVNREQR